MSVQRRIRLVLEEHRTGRVSGVDPTPGDEALATKLSERGLTVRWLRDSQVEVASSSWVGAARFSSLDVVVVPKLVGGALNVLRMIEYAAGVDILKRLPPERPDPHGR